MMPAPARVVETASFDYWPDVDEWTAELAFELLPETNRPKVEVFRGSLIVSPQANFDHQTVMRELSYLLNRAAKKEGLWAYPEVNVVSGTDLYIPDFAVFRVSGSGKISLDIADAVLLGEIVSPGNRRKDVIDRPREYASAGVPWFMRVECRNRIPAVALFELVDGEYHPIAAAAAGASFLMKQPFEFEIDPADLLDE